MHDTTEPRATARLAANTQSIYEENAAQYDAQRTRSLHEARWLARFAGTLPAGARVLDLGCGMGEPIGSWLRGEGFAVTGVDFAPALLRLARERWPDGDWREGDMRSLDLGETFDGINAWHSFFHLTQDEQRAALPRLARHLKPGGSLLVTVGPDAGEVTGHVGDAEVYHASLSPAEYATRLAECGLRLTAYMAEDPDCARDSVLMARRAG